MAQKKSAELPPDAVAANSAGEARREKEKAEKARNSEKQKRFRESMKAQGFKQVLLWAFPCPADVRGRLEAAGYRQAVAWEQAKPGKPDPALVSVAAAVHEKSIGAASSPDVNNAMRSALYAFVDAMGGWEKLDSPGTRALYDDIQETLKPFGFSL